MVKSKPEPDKTYNGWTNYETWAVNLWMDNDQGSQQYFMDMAREVKESTGDKTPNPYMHAHDNARAVLADRLKDYHDEMAEQWMADQSSVFADLLNAALSEVNWREIAAHLLTNLEG